MKTVKNKRVLLVTPNLKGIKDGVNRIQPPLGLMLMGELLRQQGFAVMIHDTALEGWDNQLEINNQRGTILIGQSDEEIKSLISEFSPGIVGISSLFSNLMDSAHDIARLVKEVDRETTVVLGGNHVSNAISDYVYATKNPASNIPARLPDMENVNVDFCMRGEVDFAFPELIMRLSEGNDISDIPGLVMRSSANDYQINAPPPPIDVTALPLPARDMVNMEGYFQIGAFHSAKSRSKRVLNIMASRGCPEKCTFCTTPAMWGSKVRWRTIESIEEEIQTAKERYNIGEIQFDDDTLTANKNKLLELCEVLKNAGIPWCTPNGVKTNYHLATQPELFKTMADSGCYQITLACESGVQRVLDEIVHKRLNVAEMKPAIENAKNAGMLVHTFWILGYPGETYEEIQRSVDFAMKSGADSFSFSILNPLPGTPIYRQVMEENLWWPGKSVEDMMFRTSLLRVDGFDSPEDFEKYVDEVNIKANSLLKEKDPERFAMKYGKDADERSLIKQT